MKFYHALYMDEILKEKQEEVKANLKACKLQYRIHVIALAKNEKNHLEIFDSVFLKQKRVNHENLFIVGIASSYHSALEMVEKIIQEVYDETNGTNIKEYILLNQETFEKGNV